MTVSDLLLLGVGGLGASSADTWDTEMSMWDSANFTWN